LNATAAAAAAFGFRESQSRRNETRSSKKLAEIKAKRRTGDERRAKRDKWLDFA